MQLDLPGLLAHRDHKAFRACRGQPDRREILAMPGHRAFPALTARMARKARKVSKARLALQEPTSP